MVGVPRDRREAQPPEALARGAEAVELRGGAHLGDPARRHGPLQPVEEAHHDRPVAPVGGADAGELHRVLARFMRGIGDGARIGFAPSRWRAPHEARRLRVDPHRRLAASETAQGAADASVGLDPDGAAKMALRRRVQLAPVDVQDRFVRGHHRVRDDHRVVGHVGAAHVEQPGDRVEGGDDEGIRLAPAHGAAHPPQPGRARLAREAGGKGRDGRAGAPPRRRTAHRIHEVLVDGLQGHPGGREFPGDPAGALHTDDRRVHADGGPARERLREILLEGGHVPVPDREQLEAAAPELLPGLEVIAPVGPEAAALQPHDELAGRAREPAHPLPARPVFGHVLALVRIARRHEVGRDLVLAHRVAEAGEARSRASRPHGSPASGSGRRHVHTAKERPPRGGRGTVA